MTWPTTVIVLAGIAAAAFALAYRHRKDKSAGDSVVLHQRLDSLTQLLSDQLKESRQSTERSVQSTSEQVVGAIKLINDELARNRQSSEKATQGVASQVQNFTKGMTELSETVHRVQESVKGVASFQEMFRSPKLRGQWGELSLGSILREYFPVGGYSEQYYFKSGEAVDAIVRLPNNLLLPIDSKFNWDNFQKMTEAEDEAPRAVYRKTFLSDVKRKVDEIATKYILPSEDTTDLALMYVPAEAIYYEIIQSLKDEDVAEYARKRKVLLCSPNTLYITLTAVTHWFKDAQVQKQTKDIIRKLEMVIKDAGILANDFRKLGDHISDAQSAYERSDKKLGHLVERTQSVMGMGEKEQEKLLV